MREIVYIIYMLIRPPYGLCEITKYTNQT